MQSLIARFRNRDRAVSGSTTVSALSDDGPPPFTPDTPTFFTQMAGISLNPNTDTDDIVPTPTTEQVHLERKILPHVHELMERYDLEEEIGTGLRPPPPTRRNTLRSKQSYEDHSTPVSRADSGLSAIQEQGLTRHVEEDSRDRSSPSPSSNKSSRRYKRSLSRLSEKLSGSGVWSTFGKTKANTSQSPRLSAFGAPSSASQVHMEGGYSSTRSMSQNTVTNSSPGVGSLGSSEVSVDQYAERSRPSSNVFSLQSAPSSLQVPHDDHATTRLSRRSTTSSRQQKHSSLLSLSSSTSPSQVLYIHPPVLQALDVNASSPRTFGHPASLSKSSDIHTVSNSSPSIMPALSPLQHPELAVRILATKSQPTLPDISNDNTTPVGQDKTEPLFPWKTFPPRRQRAKTESCVVDENSVPFPSGASSPSSPKTRKRVRRLFPIDPPKPRHRASTISDRRTSAEWNALQASRGVLTSNEWQARVSREILRLSFGESALGGIDADRRKSTGTTSAKPEIRKPHVRNVPAGESEASQVQPCSPPLNPHSTPTHIEGNQSGGDKQAPHDRTRIKSGSRREGDSSSRRMSVMNGTSGTTSGTGSVKWTAEGDASYAARQTATLPRSTGQRVYRKSILLSPSSSITAQASSSSTPGAGPSNLHRPLASTAVPKRSSLRHPARWSSEPTLTQVPETPPRPTSKGKRKAEDDDGSPPRHTTFALPPEGTPRRRTHLQSEPSPPRNAPSAFPAHHQRKRPRLSSLSPAPSPGHSRSSSSQHVPTALSTPTPSNRTPAPPPSLLVSAMTRNASVRSSQRQSQFLQPPTPTNQSVNSQSESAHARRMERERRKSTSASEMSIPFSALVAPHPPSMDRSSTYHMRDPRRPTVRPTTWALHLKSQSEERSPIHAWLFFLGFLVFPLWWAASFAPLPQTRKVGGTDVEKALVVDDPQVEHDARSWRFRCRVMSGVAFLTYVPFIILIGIFAPR